MARHHAGVKRREGVIGACLLSLMVAAAPIISAAAEPGAAPTPAGQSLPSHQEQFLQNFISQSLGRGTASTGTPAAVPSPGPQPATASPPSATGNVPATQPGAPLPQVAGDLTGAALKMVLSLVGILGLLILGGYVIRRYLLEQTFLGKRTPLMRVLARVNITPKAGVALLEVPGKILVIGITGSTLVALGELPAASSTPLEQPIAEPPASFATVLETSTESLPAAERTAAVLFKVSEAIQQKMSRLKQL